MNLTCPNCKQAVDVQKFCGNCGHRLLNDDVAVTSHSALEKKSDSQKFYKWIVAIFAFIIIWVLGSFTLSLVASYMNADERFAGVIAFILGIVVMIGIVMRDDNITVTSEEKE